MQHRTVFVPSPDTPHVAVVAVAAADGVVALTGRSRERADTPVIVRPRRSVDGVVALALRTPIDHAHDDLARDPDRPR
ncbi:hypothetical protein EAO71_02560 [Streptomyces sp. ms191]|uniref:hypothetical protein n=1 Tax=Streptomyces sp. ms191 TaxID=1827978 RepID=UPI0011CE46C8|nr:hypothetical protein [Streptomyces sp. ms191]TXS33599.1 hypothetical protein EAO71_02560 [Streptomyces sp. ms191]